MLQDNNVLLFRFQRPDPKTYAGMTKTQWEHLEFGEAYTSRISTEATRESEADGLGL